MMEALLDQELVKVLSSVDLAFVISSARLPDCPVVYASQSFYQLTGYGPEETLGRNCRFLQQRHGHYAATAKQKVGEMRSAMAEDRDCQVCLLNYRKDGTPFWNLCSMAPILDADGVAAYLGVQVDVTSSVLALARAEKDGDGVYLREACDAVEASDALEDTLAAEKRRLRSLLANWHTGRQTGAESGQELGDVGRRLSGPVASPSIPASLQQPLMMLAHSFVLSDPNLPDQPIVYASQGFLTLTGYPREQVLGVNCRFLQGAGTCPAELARLRDALAAGRPVSVNLLNYRYDGKPFMNHLHIAQVRNSAGKVTYLVGVQLDVSAPGDSPEPAAAPAPPTMLLEQKQVCGAVRIACRALCPLGLRRKACDQHRLGVAPAP